MSRRLCMLAAGLFLLAGCMELESDKFQAHRDALQRGESPDVYSQGKKAKARRPAKAVKEEAEEEPAEDEEDADADRVLSAIDRLSKE